MILRHGDGDGTASAPIPLSDHHGGCRQRSNFIHTPARVVGLASSEGSKFAGDVVHQRYRQRQEPAGARLLGQLVRSIRQLRKLELQHGNVLAVIATIVVIHAIVLRFSYIVMYR